jgi:hypothetical protein
MTAIASLSIPVGLGDGTGSALPEDTSLSLLMTGTGVSTVVSWV